MDPKANTPSSESRIDLSGNEVNVKINGPKTKSAAVENLIEMVDDDEYVEKDTEAVEEEFYEAVEANLEEEFPKFEDSEVTEDLTAAKTDELIAQEINAPKKPRPPGHMSFKMAKNNLLYLYNDTMRSPGQLTEADADELMKACDIDKDGYLSKSEWELCRKTARSGYF